MVNPQALAFQLQRTTIRSIALKDKEVEELWMVQVESHAGYRGEERPLRFQWGERSHEIVAVLDQWYGPEEGYFKDRTKEDETYILRRSFAGVWTIESFRGERSGSSALFSNSAENIAIRDGCFFRQLLLILRCGGATHDSRWILEAFSVITHV